MRTGSYIIANGFLALIGACATTPIVEPAESAAFREMVMDYQLFIVPLCDGETARAYEAQNARRDADFVESLRRTPLEADYREAVAAFADLERGRIRHCSGPPTPPGVTPPTEEEKAAEKARSTAAHFRLGDEKFADLVKLRNIILSD